MKLNLSWGILAKGIPVTTFEYGRRFDETAYKGACRNTLDVLVPVSEVDQMARAFHIEELVKLIHRSSLKGRFDAFDTYNTYTKATLQFPAPGLHTSAPVDLNLKKKDTVPLSRLRVFGVVSGGDTVTYDEGSDNIMQSLTDSQVHNYTFTNGQSSDIEVVADTLWIRLREDAPANFDLGFEYIEKLHIDWDSLLSALNTLSYDFSSPELKEIWQDESSWVERISALTMDVLETCGG